MGGKKTERNPSDIIRDFLDLMRSSQKEYQDCVTKVWQYDKKKPVDYMHDFEFMNNCRERSKLSTKIHNERIERRKYKDRAERTEKLAKFYSDKQNKQFLDRLSGLAAAQREVEEYLDGERHYNRRAGDDIGDNSHRG